MAEFVVSKSEKGDFNSISEALAAASDDDKIFVQGGTYNESIVIDKAVELYGDENDVPIVSIESGTVCKVSAGANIKFIHFNNSNGVEPEEEFYGFHALVEVSANAVFEKCEFSSSFDGNVQVYGSEVKAQFYNCSVHDANRNEMYFTDGCEAVVRDCEIYDCIESDGNESFGIALSDNSKGCLNNCKIHGLKKIGITCMDSSELLVEGCEIYDCKFDKDNINGGTGIIFLNDSYGEVNHCSFHDLQGEGIIIVSSRKPVFSDCKIEGIDGNLIEMDTIFEEKNNFSCEGDFDYEDNSDGDFDEVGFDNFEGSGNGSVEGGADLGGLVYDVAELRESDIDNPLEFHEPVEPGADNKFVIIDSVLTAVHSGNSEITIPEGVTKIAMDAFVECENVEEIFIPESVTDIENGAFYNCFNVKRINVHENNKVFCSVDGALLSKDKTLLLQVPSNIDASYIIPEGVTEIGNNAFVQCSNLKSINLPDSIVSMGISVFENCNQLENIVLSKGLKKIGYMCFYMCSNLKHVHIPEGIECIESTAFEKSGLTECFLPESLKEIGPCAFNKCEHLSYIKLPAGLEKIGTGAFNCQPFVKIDIPDNCKTFKLKDGVLINSAECSVIKAIDIGISNFEVPEGIKSIKENAFDNCKNLKGITIPDSVTSIDREVFSGCESLKDIVLPDNLEELGVSVFKNCKSLQYITLPGCVNNFYKLFDGCTNLKEVTICSKEAQELGEKAFLNCSSLESIQLPEKLTYIESSAFEGCAALKSIVIPEGVEEIKEFAFKDCTSLESILLSEKLSVIENNAFENCSSLSNILLPEGLNYIGDYVFKNTGLKEIKIPESVTEIGSWAFAYSSELTSVNIPTNLSEINTCAFACCGKLRNINISSENKDYIVFNGSLISKDGTVLIQYLFSGEKSYTVPDGIKIISTGAFRENSYIENVILPEGLSKIEDSAFEKCTSLKNINFPESLSRIENDAFNNCNSLESITIPKDLIKIGINAFIGIDSLIINIK